MIQEQTHEDGFEKKSKTWNWNQEKLQLKTKQTTGDLNNWLSHKNLKNSQAQCESAQCGKNNINAKLT